MNFKNLALKIGKLKQNEENEERDSKTIEILSEIIYYDNGTKTVQDLKEFIYDISNYHFCPCVLDIYTKKPNIENKSLSLNDLVFQEYKNTYLLSKMNLKESFYIIINLKKNCLCSDKFKKDFPLPKKSLIELKDLKENTKKGETETDNDNDLKNKIKELKETNEHLIKETERFKKEIGKLNNLNKIDNKENGTTEESNEEELVNKLGVKESSIKVDPKTNQITEIIKDEEEYSELENFYDIIIDIKSVKDIEKGWLIKMTEKGEHNFREFKDKDLIRIGVIGNSNKGKSFLLSRISKIKLPSGTSIKTEGLSIKYPEIAEFKNRKIALLDSAGVETPVLNEDNGQDSDDDEDKDEEKNQKLKDKNEELNNNNEETLKEEKAENGRNANDSSYKNLQKVDKEIFKEKSREKLITELFLQNYIINNSDILLLVVGILTYSEQKLLNRIKIDIQKLKINKPLFIIHNLKTFTTKKQVQNYIKNNLKKSSTFELKKGHKITTKSKDILGTYYFEKNSNPKIFHLIFANEGSEAGDYYNNYTIDFIENAFQNVTDLKPFDIVQTIKERFVNLSTEILEKSSEKPFNIDDIISNEEIIKNKIIKLKEPKQIVLKRCFIDELGFSNLKGSGFEPNYNYYKLGNKLIVRMEAPGNSIVDSKLDYAGEYTFIRLSGKKNEDKNTKEINNIRSTREFGEFHLDIPLKTEDFAISSNPPEFSRKQGLLIFEYILEEKKDKYHFEINEEDEV